LNLYHLCVPEVILICRAAAKAVISYSKPCTNGRFVGWNLDNKGDPITFYNPFTDSGVLEGLDSYYYFQKYGTAGQNLIQATQPTIDLVEKCLSSKLTSSRPYEALIPCAGRWLRAVLPIR
jgi:hypothetical protein